ncbi:MAG: hypothetical protein AAF196_02185 [Planctomycetota bacterium]
MKKRHPLQPSRIGRLLLRDWKRKLISLAIAVLMLVWLEQYGKGEVTLTYDIVFDSLPVTIDEESQEDDSTPAETEENVESTDSDRPKVKRPSGRLVVAFNDRDYSIDNPEQNSLREQKVRVTFSGVSRNLPDTNGTPPPLYAVARVELQNGRLELVLDGDTIRHASSVHRGLKISITPEDRRIEVVERAKLEIDLRAGHVRLAGNADRRIDPDQLEWNDAVFSPGIVSMTGPVPLLEKIRSGQTAFRFLPERIAPQDRLPDILRGRIEPIDWRLDLSTPVRLQIPRQLPNYEILLHEVPVVLYQSKDSPEQYEPRNDRMNVPIRAFGLLKTRLDEMDEQERMRWVQENAMLVARVPADARDADVITNPRLLLGTDFREGTDFELTAPLTIDFKQKNP